MDVALSHMAPSFSGTDGSDRGGLAPDKAAKLLKGGGDALIKVFQGAGFQELIWDARPFRQGEASQAGGFTFSQS